MAIRPARLVAVTVLVLVIAALAFLQAASSVLTRKQPIYAAQLFPLNGLAVEQLAAREFTSTVKTEADIVPAAMAAAETARRAFAHDPLAPKALAILAIGESDATDKQQLLNAATELNRRDLLLQGLVLEGQVARKDYVGTLDTLNSILRVHPEQKASFFPILMQALGDDAALPALAGILDRDEEWHDDFLKAASRNPAAIPNLAKLRLSQGKVDPEVDRRLIDGLVAAGEVEQARRIFASATGRDTTVPGENATLDWISEFPPFDWKLADEAGFRAQLGGSATELEIFVRGGKGGPIAERLITLPTGPFTIRVAHTLAPAEQVKDVRLQLRCPGAEEPFFDEPFRIRPHGFRVRATPTQCTSVLLTVHARAWSGRSSIRGNLDALEIVQN